MALDKLAGLLGSSGLLTPEDGLQRYESEWRGRYQSRALAVARPADLSTLAAVVKYCARHQIPIVAQGGNTGLVGGAVAGGERRELILSLERMKAIRELDASSASMTVEAGCTLEQASRAAADAGWRLPLALSSGGSATIGGVLATNAGGNETIRFGNARAMVLGVEAVFPDGSLWQGLSALRKDNSGYDLAQLLVGSEGTLAVISAATLALQPMPRQRETVWLAVDSPQAALAVLARVRRALGETLTAFELMPAQAMAFVLDYLDGAGCPVEATSPWHVLIECDSAVVGTWLRSTLLEVLEAVIEHGEATDGALAQSEIQRAAFWQLRESISDAQGLGGVSLKHDVSVPTVAIPEFIERTLAELAVLVPGIRPCVFGHVGDGNLHFNLSQPEAMSADAFRALEEQINHCVFARVRSLDGSIAAEHGVGLLRRERLAGTKDPAALEAMKRIKRALDPLGLLNPGKVLPSE